MPLINCSLRPKKAMAVAVVTISACVIASVFEFDGCTLWASEYYQGSKTWVTTTHSEFPGIGLGSLPTARGGGIITIMSGCRMARWIFNAIQDRHGRDCRWSSPQPKISQNLYNASQLEENDTIYVPHTEVGKFVNDILDGVLTNIVVVSGDSIDWPPARITAVHKLLNHPHVLKWFCQNQHKYGRVDAYHPKIASFPYGLKEGMPWEGGKKIITLPSYKQIFFGSIQDKSLLDKTIVIFVGPLGNNGDGGRSRIPQSTERMTPTDYHLVMAKSKYVVSPNGDRPDCYRHYEAIGLGAVPITQLDPVSYAHFGVGSVIFNNTQWNLALLEKELDPWPIVNRNMIREDYWMDWVDHVSGSRLNWNTYDNGNGLTEVENSLLAMLD